MPFAPIGSSRHLSLWAPFAVEVAVAGLGDSIVLAAASSWIHGKIEIFMHGNFHIEIYSKVPAVAVASFASFAVGPAVVAVAASSAVASAFAEAPFAVPFAVPTAAGSSSSSSAVVAEESIAVAVLASAAVASFQVEWAPCPAVAVSSAVVAASAGSQPVAVELGMSVAVASVGGMRTKLN